MYSHLMPGTELIVLLIVGLVYRDGSTSAYFLQTAAFWLLGFAFILPPFLYNPEGLEFSSVSRGWDQWAAWWSSRDLDKGASWEQWWREQTEPMRTATTSARGELNTHAQYTLNLSATCHAILAEPFNSRLGPNLSRLSSTPLYDGRRRRR